MLDINISNIKYDIYNIISQLEQEPKTNREKISNMSNEELVKLILEKDNCIFICCDYCNNHSTSDSVCYRCIDSNITCKQGIKKWLESEAKDEICRTN